MTSHLLCTVRKSLSLSLSETNMKATNPTFLGNNIVHDQTHQHIYINHLFFFSSSSFSFHFFNCRPPDRALLHLHTA
jgi:hypothetical protein